MLFWLFISCPANIRFFSRKLVGWFLLWAFLAPDSRWTRSRVDSHPALRFWVWPWPSRSRIGLQGERPLKSKPLQPSFHKIALKSRRRGWSLFHQILCCRLRLPADVLVSCCWRRGLVVRTSVFVRRTFPDLGLIYDWHVTSSTWLVTSRHDTHDLSGS